LTHPILIWLAAPTMIITALTVLILYSQFSCKSENSLKGKLLFQNYSSKINNKRKEKKIIEKNEKNKKQTNK